MPRILSNTYNILDVAGSDGKLLAWRSLDLKIMPKNSYIYSILIPKTLKYILLVEDQFGWEGGVIWDF